MSTGSVSVTFDGSSTAAPAEATAVADVGAPPAMAAVASAAPASNGAPTQASVHSFGVLLGVVGGLVLAL
jgi:hypothetical protein